MLRLVEWIRATAARDFPDDVALVVLYGSHVTRTAGPHSDIDCFFVPRTERGLAFARTFIIVGIGYDIFPLRWERVEGLADLREPLMPLLGDSVVLHAASPAEEARFLGLRARLQANLADEELTHHRAVERLGRARARWDGTAALDDVGRLRTQAGLVALELAQAVAFANGTYFHHGPKRLIDDLAGLSTPSGFLPLFLGLAAAPDAGAVLDRTGALLAATARFLEDDDAGSAPPLPARGAAVVDVHTLAHVYEEISSSFTKVRVACDAGDPVAAFLAAVLLQDCLDDEVPVAVGLPGLLEAHDPADLSRLRSRLDAAEATLVRAIESGGAVIERYPDLGAFLAAQRHDAVS